MVSKAQIIARVVAGSFDITIPIAFLQEYESRVRMQSGRREMYTTCTVMSCTAVCLVSNIPSNLFWNCLSLLQRRNENSQLNQIKSLIRFKFQ